jgi:hypothetical protein
VTTQPPRNPVLDNGVQGAVERAVTAAVEPVAQGLAAAGRKWAGPGQGGERGLAADSAGVGEADDHLGGGDRADAVAGGQAGGQFVDDGVELGPVGGECVAGLAHGQGQAADLVVAHGVGAGGVRG